ncbi:MAG: hypothetical protein P4L87_25085 [Formivibrio sp.]|nr:hypothetical protein [Formivibrio sp.]
MSLITNAINQAIRELQNAAAGWPCVTRSRDSRIDHYIAFSTDTRQNYCSIVIKEDVAVPAMEGAAA